MTRVNFDTFGDRSKASSRLRAFMLAEQLRALGHDATINEAVDVDLQVFQKRRDLRRLRLARDAGARVVFDFDDNYLLDDVGAKADLLAFMNAADVVTVGSGDLLRRASQYHPNVVLFENPLDVDPGSPPKRDYDWQGRVGWFGAPENQGVLHDLGLRQRVTTVTAGGDVPWAADTIDQHLRGFDLVILPVAVDAWTLAKNANRLLKCVALGVPALASRTPEHVHAFAAIGLPPWLLVEPGGDWEASIEQVAARYRELPRILESARQAAQATFGAGPVTRRWLRDVTALHVGQPPLDLSPTAARRLADTDVVIVAELAPERLPATLASLRPVEFAVRSVAVVSPLPVDQTAAAPFFDLEVADRHDDYFEIYPSLARALATRTGTATLVVQAGVQVLRGLYNEIESWPADRIHLLRGQLADEAGQVAQEPPGTIDQLMTLPHNPMAMIVPNPSVDSTGLDARFASFAVWEMLIRRVGRDGEPLTTVREPLVAIPSQLISTTPMQAYAKFLAATDPEIAKELPSVSNEWSRLAFALHAAVVEAHSGLFGAYLPTVVPRLASKALGPAPEDAEAKRMRETASRLALLPATPADAPPELLRTADGKIYLVDGEQRRYVANRVVAQCLESLYGPVQKWPEDREDLPDGPRMDIVAAEDGTHFIIAGGLRHQVRGLPTVAPARSRDLGRFPRSDNLVDLSRWARGVNEPSARRQASRSDHAPHVPVPTTPPEAARSLAVAPDSPPREQVPGSIHRHDESWVQFGELGAHRPYLPTFGEAAFVNDQHRRLERDTSAYEGTLRVEDALKLYELAFHTSGLVLDLGIANGVSTAILADAVTAAGGERRVVAVDPRPGRIEEARRRLTQRELHRAVELVVGHALQESERLVAEGARFDLAFIDRLTVANDVERMCMLLSELVSDGGFVVFHDFNDRRARDEQASGHAVWRTVTTALDATEFEFFGVFGCSGVYRKRQPRTDS